MRSSRSAALRIPALKILFLAILSVSFGFSARAEPPEPTVDQLLQSVRLTLPKGWTASYDKEYTWLEISRDEAVLSWSASFNQPADEKPPERIKFAFGFSITPLVPPQEYRRLRLKNAKIQKEIATLYEDLVRKHVSRKFDSFSSSNEGDKQIISRYDALNKSLHKLPDFYFDDISLEWGFNSPSNPRTIVADKSIRDECKGVRERVVKLLSQYEVP